VDDDAAKIGERGRVAEPRGAEDGLGGQHERLAGLAAAAPLVAWFYGQYPFLHLMTLLLVVAARPIGGADPGIDAATTSVAESPLRVVRI
jgi:hypothetical protein